MTIIDISVPLTERVPIWPDEPAFSAISRQSGEAMVSFFSFGSHTGTHIDAPRHFFPDKMAIDEIPLDVFVGKVLVCHCLGKEIIDLDELKSRDLAGVKRILFRTDNSKLWQQAEFCTHYTSLSQDAAKHLVNIGVTLIGIDYLSVEAFGSKGSLVHKALLGGGVTILEGLDLTAVDEGEYTLVAFPLFIPGGDGSPARAVLIS